MNIAVVLLAAGQGTRMKSDQPKVLHKLCGKPMVGYIADAAAEIKPKRFITVVSPFSAEAVAAELPKGAEMAIQSEAMGTGDAVRAAAPALPGFKGTIVILCGDTPLVKGATLREMIKLHEDRQAAATVLTAKVDNPKGYGRVIRGNGGVKKIVEDRDATSTELCIREVNTGTYCFDAELLFEALEQIRPENSQKEYYLTDCIGIFFERNEKVIALQVEDETETMGINSRVQLADAEMIMQARINREHMVNGVTIIHPMLAYIDAGVKIGRDTIVHPNTFLNGKTIIGENCLLGPSSRIVESEVGDGTEVTFSVVRESKLGENVKIGPFANIRPGCRIGDGGKVGSFVEVKKTKLGSRSKVPHLSYIGDAVIGQDVNIGAGTITCNFDGDEKYKTLIEDNAFIGSDTMLIAPVKVGKHSYTGAGSVITKDIPDDSLGIGRADQRVIPGWKKKSNKKRRSGA